MNIQTNFKRESFIAIPKNLDNKEDLERFLSILIEKLDILFNNRGKGNPTALSVSNTIAGLRQDINNLSDTFATKDELTNAIEPLATKDDLNTKVDQELTNAPNQLASNATTDDIINTVNSMLDKLQLVKVFS